MPAFAQRQYAGSTEAPKAGEGEINRQQEFFDPTQKEEKVREDYHFAVDYRLQIGYVQNQQRSAHSSYSNPFLFGGVLGATFDFRLPAHFSIQTGLNMNITYGQIEQHWRSMDNETTQTEYLRHGINQYYLSIPVRAYYTQKLWKDLNLLLYGGPQIQIGLAQIDRIHDHLSDAARQWMNDNGIPTTTHDRYLPCTIEGTQGPQQRPAELQRTNIQLGVGGGFEWQQYRLVAGYDFGLNNLAKYKPTTQTHMWEWGWFVTFAYRLNKTQTKQQPETSLIGLE